MVEVWQNWRVRAKRERRLRGEGGGGVGCWRALGTLERRGHCGAGTGMVWSFLLLLFSSSVRWVPHVAAPAPAPTVPCRRHRPGRLVATRRWHVAQTGVYHTRAASWRYDRAPLVSRQAGAHDR